MVVGLTVVFDGFQCKIVPFLNIRQQHTTAGGQISNYSGLMLVSRSRVLKTLCKSPELTRSRLSLACVCVCVC